MKASSLAGAVVGAVVKIIVIILVVMFVYNGAVVCYNYGYRVFMEPPISAGEGRTVTVTVPKTFTATELGELFYEKGLTRDAKLFSLQYLFSEFKADMIPGTYELSTAMTAEEMMEVMATPQTEETE